jgi:uncharacterized membrane protein
LGVVRTLDGDGCEHAGCGRRQSPERLGQQPRPTAHARQQPPTSQHTRDGIIIIIIIIIITIIIIIITITITIITIMIIIVISIIVVVVMIIILGTGVMFDSTMITH